MIDTYKLLTHLPNNFIIVPYTVKVPLKYMFKTKDIVKIKLKQIIQNLTMFCNDNKILFHNLLFFENHKNSREHLHGWLFIETKYIDKVEMYMLKRQQNLDGFYWISGNNSGDYYYNLNYLIKDLKDIKYYTNNKYILNKNYDTKETKMDTTLTEMDLELIKSVVRDVLQELSYNSSQNLVKPLLNKVSRPIQLSKNVSQTEKFDTKLKKFDTKYLYQIKEKWYFCKRIKNKTVRISLKTENLIEAMKHRETLLKMNDLELLKLKGSFLSVNFTNAGFTIEKTKDDESDELVLKTVSEIVKNKQTQQNTLYFAQNKTIGELFNEFIENAEQKGKVKESSIKHYKTAYNHLLKYFDKEKDIQTFILKDFEFLQTQLNKQLSNNSTINTITYIKMFFNYAVKHEYIQKNPLEHLDLISKTESKKENFTDDEINELILTDKIPSDFKDLIRFSAYSGMRINEIINLKLENIKKENEILYIDIIKSKTAAGIRKVPIHDKILDLIDLDFLKNLKMTTKAKDIEEAIGRKANEQIQKIINDKTKTFHSLRASAISKMVNVEKNKIENIQILVGHDLEKSKKLTLKTYAKQIDLRILKDTIETIKY